VKGVAVSSAIAGALVCAAGIYLLSTVGDEFDPRGRFGVLLVVAGVAFLAVAAWAWRGRREAS
jgi:multidrug transporter EmrE-like cation transporter